MTIIGIITFSSNYLLYSMDEFILVQKKEVEEFHLFVLNNSSQEIIYSLSSVCGGMVSKDIQKIIFHSKTEHEARILCALQGKEVCSICVGKFYSKK